MSLGEPYTIVLRHRRPAPAPAPLPVVASPAQRKTRGRLGPALMLVGLLAVSCAAPLNKILDPTPALQAPIISAEAHLQAGDTKAVLADLEQEKKVAAQVAAQDVATQEKLAKDEEQIKQLNSQFWSPRQKRLFWWAVAIAGTMVAGYVAFSIFSGAAVGPLGGGVVATGLFGVLTGGISWVHAFFAKLGAMLWHPQTVAARAAALNPPPPITAG